MVRPQAASLERTLYVHVDHLGSVNALTDGVGAVVEQRSYDPFGARRNPAAVGVVHDHGIARLHRARDEDDMTPRRLSADECRTGRPQGQALAPPCGRGGVPIPSQDSPTIETKEEGLSMTRYGYGYVTEKGFMAFSHDLEEGAWQGVSIQGFDGAQRALSGDALGMPRDVAWKLRATWAIAALRDALGASPEVLAELDAAWDASERRLYHRICCSAEDRDPAVREAAERLRGALLSGNGTAQTNLTYDEEVDYGRHQVVLMSKGAVARDVQICGLAGAREEIAEVTEALAHGLGRAPGEKRKGSRHQRIRAARSACAAAFNGIHGEIAWFIGNMVPSKGRTRAEKLLAPFRALLERYPAGSGAGDLDEEAPAQAPAPAASAAPQAG